MIGFRNTIVHDYLEIDRKLVYNIVQHHMSDIDDIRRVLAEFL